MELWAVPRHHLFVRDGAMAVHSGLATTQLGIILYQIGSVKGEPVIDDDDPPLSAPLLRDLAYVTVHEALDFPCTEAYAENKRKENASRDEASSLTVLEQLCRRNARGGASH